MININPLIMVGIALLGLGMVLGYLLTAGKFRRDERLTEEMNANKAVELKKRITAKMKDIGVLKGDIAITYKNKWRDMEESFVALADITGKERTKAAMLEAGMDMAVQRATEAEAGLKDGEDALGALLKKIEEYEDGDPGQA